MLAGFQPWRPVTLCESGCSIRFPFQIYPFMSDGFQEAILEKQHVCQSQEDFGATP